MIPLTPDNVRLLSFLASKTPTASSPCFHLPVICGPHPRAADVFATQGRKPTPRSIHIVAGTVPWREPTGDSAETRVPSQPRRVSRASLPTTPLPPRPRFRAPSLHLSLLRSPAWSMCIQYMLHPFFVFLVRTYFDFNIVVFILVQCVSPPLCSFFPLTQHSVSSHPGQSNSARNWSRSCSVYCFWRRWRVSEYCPHYFRFHVSLLTYVHASTLVQAFLDHCTQKLYLIIYHTFQSQNARMKCHSHFPSAKLTGFPLVFPR